MTQELETAAKCQACSLSAPNGAAAPKNPETWTWPNDFECLPGQSEFPDAAHICPWWTPEDSNH